MERERNSFCETMSQASMCTLATVQDEMGNRESIRDRNCTILLLSTHVLAENKCHQAYSIHLTCVYCLMPWPSIHTLHLIAYFKVSMEYLSVM